MIQLQFVSPEGPARGLSTLKAATGEAASRFERLPPREELEGEVPAFGVWHCARSRDGVVVGVKFCDDVELAMHELIAGLTRRGVSGRFDLWEDGLPHPEIVGDAGFGAHVRVRGHQVDGRWWRAQADAFNTVVTAASAWVMAFDKDAELSIEHGQVGRLGVERDDQVATRVLEMVEPTGLVSLDAAARGSIRSLTVFGFDGRLILRVAGDALFSEGYQPELAALTDLWCSLSDQIAYAYVGHRANRPPSWSSTVNWDSDDWHWPRRPFGSPRAETMSAISEDLYAPDAFVSQLLGPGYADRIPPVSLWRAEKLNNGATLLQARDPNLWLCTPFEPSSPNPPWEMPDLLVQARAELAPILFNDRAART